MKKFILSILLLFMACNLSFSTNNITERLSKRLDIAEYKTIYLKRGTLYPIVIDNHTGVSYLFIDSGSINKEHAITPLIKPAVYTHKK